MKNLNYIDSINFTNSFKKALQRVCVDELHTEVSGTTSYDGCIEGERLDIYSETAEFSIITYYTSYPGSIYATSPEPYKDNRIEYIRVYMHPRISLAKKSDEDKFREVFYAGSKEVLIAITPFILKNMEGLVTACKETIAIKNDADRNERYQTYLKLKEEFEKE